MSFTRTAPHRLPSRRRGTASLDGLIIGLAAIVIAVGGYGMYDLVMAPQTLAKDDGRHAAMPRRGNAGFLGSVFGNAGVELCPGQNEVNILVLGTDEQEEGGRADSIILAMIHKDTKRAAAISVPRDLMVHLEGHGTQKINAVYAFNKRKGTGELMTARVVSDILGVQIDHYIKTDVGKFPALFDAFGGLDIYVDRDMDYDDSTRGGLHIHMTRGFHHLNGTQLEGFVRHRHDKHGRFSTDFERSQRHQYVLKELIKQKGNLATATHLPQIIHAVQDMMGTDMSLPELMALGLLARQVDTAHVTSRIVPTRAKMAVAWYAILEPEATKAMMADVESALAGGEITPDKDPERNNKIGAGELAAPGEAVKPEAAGPTAGTATAKTKSHRKRTQ